MSACAILCIFFQFSRSQMNPDFEAISTMHTVLHVHVSRWSVSDGGWRPRGRGGGARPGPRPVEKSFIGGWSRAAWLNGLLGAAGRPPAAADLHYVTRWM
eukprot:COSAG02_NODE_8144_length_2692_cov_6.782491_2_plen_100_part_00